MTVAAGKKRKAVGFEWRPPRCGNCSHIERLPIGHPDRNKFAKCAKHHFPIRTWSICDTWQSSTGDVLEDA